MLHEEGRFDPAAPGQDLLIEAHRIDEPMLWKSIRYDSIINSPGFRDYEHGVHAVREELWRGVNKVEVFGLKDLAALGDRAGGEMEGAY